MVIFKADLIRRVWEKVNVGKEGRKERLKQDEVEAIINTFLEEMSQCMVDGDDIILRGFGKFMSKVRKARTTYNSDANLQIRRLRNKLFSFLWIRHKIFPIFAKNKDI